MIDARGGNARCDRATACAPASLQRARRRPSSTSIASARLDGALGCYLLVDAAGARRGADAVDAARKAGRDPGAARRRADRAQGHLRHARGRDHRGLEDPRGLDPARTTRRSTARLRAARARSLLGKLNWTSSRWARRTRTPPFKPTRNPWDRRARAGRHLGRPRGGGRRGAVRGALGTDTGGSIRQPAAFCGVVGHQADLRPRVALRRDRVRVVARSGRARSARTVEDAAALLEAIAGPRSARLDLASTRRWRRIARGRAGRRAAARACAIGVPASTSQAGIDPEVGAAVRAALDALARARRDASSTSRCRTPSYAHRRPTTWSRTAEASSNLARYDGVRYGTARADGDARCATCTRRRAARASAPRSKRRIMLGTYALRSGYYDAYYKKAQQVRDAHQARLRRRRSRSVRRDRHADHADAGVPARREASATRSHMYLADIFTRRAATSPGSRRCRVPCGFTEARPADRPAAARPAARRGDAASASARALRERAPDSATRAAGRRRPA